MRSKFKFFVPVILFIALILILFLILSDNKNRLNNQQHYIDIENLRDINGTQIIVDKPMLIHFFATWCIACKVDMQKLILLGGGNNYKLIGVNTTEPESYISKWVHSNQGNTGYSHVIVPDAKSSLRKLSIKGVPHSFVIGKHGKILYHYEGELSKEIIENEILPKL